MQAQFFTPILRLPKFSRKFMAQYNKGVPLSQISGRRYYALVNSPETSFNVPDTWTPDQLKAWALTKSELERQVIFYYEGSYHLLPTPFMYDFGEAKIMQLLTWHYNGKKYWVMCGTHESGYVEAPLFDTVRQSSKNPVKQQKSVPQSWQPGVDYVVF